MRCPYCGGIEARAGCCVRCLAQGHTYRLMSREGVSLSLRRMTPGTGAHDRRDYLLSHWEEELPHGWERAFVRRVEYGGCL